MSLHGKHIIVTAGPTIEPIDPVRFISNHSSGKMGYALAEELARRGANVSLISGKTSLECPTGCVRTDVVTAEDMYREVMKRFPEADGAVMCAAVADYTPVHTSNSKIKKSDDEISIRLRKTKDIAAEAGKIKDGRLLVGFALETDNETDNARNKLQRKNLDFIVLNSLRDAGAGFATDTNKITIMYNAPGKVFHYPLDSKKIIAKHIADHIENWFCEQRPQPAPPAATITRKS